MFFFSCYSVTLFPLGTPLRDLALKRQIFLCFCALLWLNNSQFVEIFPSKEGSNQLLRRRK
ncbi:MAG: hypothetical protein D3925_05070 [Candidatus Electrothrix sp. AR5]|nr:hypothetical protein [Candidatus Electrothrix sp. AR5]